MRLHVQSEWGRSGSIQGPLQHSRLARLLTRKRALRAILMGLLILGLFGVFTHRLWRFQFVEGQAYRQEAEEQSTRVVTVEAPRGVIYDRHGDRLVRNVPSFYVSVVPGYLPEEADEAVDVLVRLADLMGMPYSGGEGDDEGLRTVVLSRLAGWLVDFSYDQDPAEALSVGLEQIQSVAPYRPIVIKRNVERERALLVAQEASHLPGVSVEVRSVRDYPYGPLLSQMLGYLLPIPSEQEDSYREQGYDPATDRIGGAGVEATYEGVLRGTKGQQIVEADVLGRVLRVVDELAQPVPGENVYLTIDLGLQKATEDALERGMGDAVSPRGAAVVMDPQTGEVLSMVSLPTYDNNVFVRGVSDRDLESWKDVHRPLFNHAIQVGVPPGSVFKVVVASAALQEGVVGRQTTLTCPGRIVVPNKYYPNDPGYDQPFYCWNTAGHGALDVVGGIAHSCNIFFYKAGGGFEETEFQGLGVSRIAEYARSFGLGERTGIELPAESAGLVPTADWKRHAYGESWSTGDTYNLSIGQGFLEVTPLQMLNAVNTIANGGTVYQPQIVHHVTGFEGNTTEPFEPQTIRDLPVERGYLEMVREGMEGAVDYGTAARRGQIEGVRIGGKTGTAHFCDDIMCGVGYEQPEHAWFTAFAPVEDPEISVIVFLYNGGEGSVTAVPVARDILSYYFGVEAEPEEQGETSS